MSQKHCNSDKSDHEFFRLFFLPLLGSESKVSFVAVKPPQEFLAQMYSEVPSSSEEQSWDKQKSVLLKRVAKLLEAKKSLQQEKTRSLPVPHPEPPLKRVQV